MGTAQFVCLFVFPLFFFFVKKVLVKGTLATSLDGFPQWLLASGGQGTLLGARLQRCRAHFGGPQLSNVSLQYGIYKGKGLNDILHSEQAALEYLWHFVHHAL